MNSVIRAHLVRLLQRRTVVLAGLGAAVFSAVAAVTVFGSAKTAGASAAGDLVTLGSLAGPGGGTQAFATAAAFVGLFVFVTFIALRGAEQSGGTFRALLLRDPRRLRVLVGQVAGILVIAAGVLAVAEALTFGASLAMAAAHEVPTSQWFSVAALGDAAKDYATVLAGVAAWAVFGTTLAVVFGSVPLALGVGFVWAGPFEHLVADAWSAGNQWFPGLVLQSLIAGGTDELSLARAVMTAIVYTALAATLALFLTARRDVTV
jgi:ABC-2 type transport system permease protein